MSTNWPLLTQVTLVMLSQSKYIGHNQLTTHDMNSNQLEKYSAEQSDALRFGSEFLDGCNTPESIIQKTATLMRGHPEVSSEILLAATTKLHRDPAALLQLVHQASIALDARTATWT